MITDNKTAKLKMIKIELKKEISIIFYFLFVFKKKLIITFYKIHGPRQWHESNHAQEECPENGL
jgi:hypothetical protein